MGFLGDELESLKSGKNKNILLQCNCTNFAPIKRYCPFCFLWLYIRRHRFSLQDLCQLSVFSVCVSFYFVCMSVFMSAFSFLSFCIFCLCLLCLSVCPSFCLSVSSVCLSDAQKWKRIFCFTIINRAWPWRMADLFALKL